MLTFFWTASTNFWCTCSRKIGLGRPTHCCFQWPDQASQLQYNGILAMFKSRVNTQSSVLAFFISYLSVYSYVKYGGLTKGLSNTRMSMMTRPVGRQATSSNPERITASSRVYCSIRRSALGWSFWKVAHRNT